MFLPQAIHLLVRPVFPKKRHFPNAASPSETIAWTASLQGGAVVDLEFAKTNYERGVAFRYDQATRIERHILISPEFGGEHADLAAVVRHAAGLQSSKWSLMQSWEEVQ